MRALLSIALVCALVSFETVPTWAQAAPAANPQIPAAPAAPPPDRPLPGRTPAVTPAQTPSQTSAPGVTQPAVSVPGSLNLKDASLVQVIDILARDLHINYILDPKVKGTVTISTYGEIRAVDVRNLLETILRMNGFSMVQVGNIFRIVPSDAASRLPISPQADLKEFSDSEKVVLNLVFLKFVDSSEMVKLLDPFVGEGGKIVSYDPANLLIIQDNSRSMRRTLDLINMFDAEAIAGQRVRSFTLNNGRPSDVAKELESIFKAYAQSDKNTAVRFIPLDRISTIIAVVANPAAFKDVASWIEKLDVAVRQTAGAPDNHVYKFKYGRAEIVGSVIAQLYGAAVPQSNSGYSLPKYGGFSGSLAGGGSGFGGSGGGFGGNGFGGGSSYNGFGGGNNGSFLGNNGSFGGGNSNNFTASAAAQVPTAAGGATGAAGAATTTATPFGNSVTPNQTGQYLAPNSATGIPGAPRIIPNPFDNTLLVQCTPQQWESMLRLLEQLDIPPRQVLIDAKIYEVDLTGTLQYGVAASLQPRDKVNRQLTGTSNQGGSTVAAAASNLFSGTGLQLTAGMLVGHSRELLAAVQAAETRSLAKSISAPQIIATDSIPASITVGEEVPTVSATSVSTGLGGSTTSAVQNVGTGTNLNIIARVNSSGVVTLVIDQDISAAEATPPSLGAAVSSQPSFSRRNVSTQITIEDGDTIAIGGIVQEATTSSVSGIPFLDRIPYIGGIFGSKNYNTTRTELIVFLTPHVIYDTNGIADATEEVKSQMRYLKKDIRKE